MFQMLGKTTTLAVLVVIFLTAQSVVRADPASELASFSVFPTADLAQLAGDAKTVRGAP